MIDGDFFYLRNRGSEETACRAQPPVFAASIPKIRVSSRPVGKIEIAEDRLWVRWMGCRQLFHFQPQDGFMRSSRTKTLFLGKGAAFLCRPLSRPG